MVYFGENNEYILCECEICKGEMYIERNNIAEEDAYAYRLFAPIKCRCGAVDEYISRAKKSCHRIKQELFALSDLLHKQQNVSNKMGEITAELNKKFEPPSFWQSVGKDVMFALKTFFIVLGSLIGVQLFLFIVTALMFFFGIAFDESGGISTNANELFYTVNIFKHQGNSFLGNFGLGVDKFILDSSKGEEEDLDSESNSEKPAKTTTAEAATSENSGNPENSDENNESEENADADSDEDNPELSDKPPKKPGDASNQLIFDYIPASVVGVFIIVFYIFLIVLFVRVLYNVAKLTFFASKVMNQKIKINQRKKEYQKQLDDLSVIHQNLCEQINDFTVLPNDYKNIRATDSVARYFVNNRTDTIREAINLYHEEDFRIRMLEYNKASYNEMRQTRRYTKALYMMTSDENIKVDIKETKDESSSSEKEKEKDNAQSDEMLKGAFSKIKNPSSNIKNPKKVLRIPPPNMPDKPDKPNKASKPVPDSPPEKKQKIPTESVEPTPPVETNAANEKDIADEFDALNELQELANSLNIDLPENGKNIEKNIDDIDYNDDTDDYEETEYDESVESDENDKDSTDDKDENMNELLNIFPPVD